MDDKDNGYKKAGVIERVFTADTVMTASGIVIAMWLWVVTP